MFLLDTNVVSELRKTASGKADARVVAWAESVDADSLFLSAITILELEIGVLSIERRDAPRGALLRHWLDHQVLPAFQGRIMPVDGKVAKLCARLHVPDRRPERDALIAATALASGFTVVTRNTSDFAATDVAFIDPWQTPGRRRDPRPP